MIKVVQYIVTVTMDLLFHTALDRNVQGFHRYPVNLEQLLESL